MATPKKKESVKAPELVKAAPMPVEEIKPGRYRMMVDVVIGYCKYYGRDTDHDCLGCSQFRIIEPEIICPNGWLDGATFHAEEEKI